MSFLQSLFNNSVHESTPDSRVRRTCFEELTKPELETHLAINSYGPFTLTDAIRPSYDLEVMPRQGYRPDVYRDNENNSEIPVLMATATREILFDLFLELLDPLGPVVDVILETSHHHEQGEHSDLCREDIDLPRPRTIQGTFDAAFVEKVQRLRGHIVEVRESKGPSQEAVHV